MSTTPEYESMKDCVPQLRHSVKANILTLGGELLAARLISDEHEERLRDTNVNERERAAKLVSLVLNKVQEASQHYHAFVDILKKDLSQHETVIQQLQARYDVHERRLEAEAQNLSLQDADSDTPVPRTSQSGASLTDSSSQVVSSIPIDGSMMQQQPHPAFGATCGCRICLSDLGCPNPITPETTFPLLEDVDGLDRAQKEVLRARLKDDTQNIMLQFYTLLSRFYKSLKRDSEVALDDLKAYLMALEAFDDDEEHRSVFHEQKDELERANTLNEVFKVIKTFCSFFNYNLVKYLINLLGSDDDKTELEMYETKFEDYAKRRVCESPKLASPTAEQTNVYVKLESRFSDNYSLVDLQKFRIEISKILKVSPYVMRLCCVEKGCIKLTFQIPHFVEQQLFPLTSEQESGLVQMGVTRLSLVSGNYKYPNKHTSFALRTKATITGDSDEGIIRAYFEYLDAKPDEFFCLPSVQEMQKDENSDEDDDIDSDYESALTDSTSLLSFSDISEDEGSEKTDTISDITCVNIPSWTSVSLLDAKPTLSSVPTPNDSEQESITLSLPIERQNSTSIQQHSETVTTGLEWEVECTSKVVKKLSHRKTPKHVVKAICNTIINHLARGACKDMIQANKEHKLFQTEVLGGKVTILWEKAIQFSPKLSSKQCDYFAEIIRIWDIVIHKRSLRSRIKAINKAWNQERHNNSTEITVKPCDVHDSQAQDQASLRRVFQRVLSTSNDPSEIHLFHPADFERNHYKPMTLHHFPHNIEDLLATRRRKFDLPLKLQPQEQKIIDLPFTGPIIVVGRSGTGKTTCCLYRMVQEYLSCCSNDATQQSTDSEDSPPLRQLFVTKNVHLCQIFKAQFERLIAYHSLTMTSCYEKRHVKDSQCPLFLTWDEFLDLIDNSLYDQNSWTSPYDESNSSDSEFDSSQPQPKDCSMRIKGTLVTAEYFVSKIWKEIKPKGDLCSINPEAVWMEIKSFIKGYETTGELKQERYVDTHTFSPKIAPNFSESRQMIYEVYKSYKDYCKRMSRTRFIKLYDECDLVSNLHEKVHELRQKHVKNYNKWFFDSVYVDEVQDFTHNEVHLLAKCCKSSNLFLTGDTAQTVMRDVSFRFKDLKTSFFEDDSSPSIGKAPPIHELTINYRSHSGILNLAGHVLSILEEHFPNSIDRVPRDKGMFPGPTPKFIKSCNPETLKLLLAANAKELSDIQFGHQQTVIVRTEESKRDLPFTEVQAFSVYESKGLEYDDVLLYDFFTGCTDKKGVWKKAYSSLHSPIQDIQEPTLNVELKQLYTAITRAKVNLWIYESKHIEEHDLPILAEWTESTNQTPLIEIVDPDDPSFKFEQSFSNATKSTPRQWKSQGDWLFGNEKWTQAILCYKQANRFDLVAKTEAVALTARSQPNPTPKQHREIAIAYLKYTEITDSPEHLSDAAYNLLCAAKSPREVLDAIQIYTRLGKLDEAITALLDNKLYIEASKVYEHHCEEYLKAVTVLIQGEYYIEAAAKAKRFEEQHKLTSSDLEHHSSKKIAMDNILKFCVSPNHASKMQERNFHDLLAFINDEELKNVYRKQAGRFSEALASHFHSHELEKFYRLAFARGPEKVSSQEQTLGYVTSFYDSALRLSSTCEHYAINNALAIQSGRAFFHDQNPRPITLCITQLERIFLTDSEDVEVQMNAILLLARYDHTKTEEAIEFCSLHNCVPGEVELYLYHFRESGEKPLMLPNCYSLTDQLEIVHKIQRLLSLDSNTLITQYKDILGLYKGEEDVSYTTHDRKKIPNPQPVEKDCIYLLPHQSQDIWLKTLTQGRVAKSQDIDGMYVISPNVLSRRITDHLRGGLRSIGRALVRHYLFESPLFAHYQTHQLKEHYCTNFDTKGATVFLESCVLVLQHETYDKKIKREAVNSLRQYNSVTNVSFFPVCDNYMSYLNVISEVAWEEFKSITEDWVKECVYSPVKFDFLKLWEQSSIAGSIETLARFLSDLKLQGDSHQDRDMINTVTSAMSWIHVCKTATGTPDLIVACREFVRDCLPKLVSLNHSTNSIINAVSIFGTILLVIISCIVPRTLIFPHMYNRALSVYGSLLQTEKSILTLCFQMPKESHVLKAATEMLRLALDQVIHSILWSAAVNENGNLLRQCLILTLTLFVNYIILHPKSQDIQKIHKKLNLCLEKKKARQFGFNFMAVCDSIQQAKSIAHFLKVIEYLLCPNETSDRYEALACVQKHRAGIKIVPLSDKDVQKLPPVIITGFEIRKPTLQLVVSPLLPKSERTKALSFVLQHSKVHPLRIVVHTCPPWTNLPKKNRELDPDLIEFLDLGFKQAQLRVKRSERENICHVCKFNCRDKADHEMTDSHIKQLRLYRQFMALQDTSYTRCVSTLEATKGGEIAKEELVKSNKEMIDAIYKHGEWEKGIDLLHTNCIPRVKQMISELTHHVKRH